MRALLVWVTITRYHGLKWLKEKFANLFLVVLEAVKSKIMVPEDLVAGDGLLLACRQLSSFWVHMWWTEQTLVSLLSSINPIMGAPALRLHLNLIIS